MTKEKKEAAPMPPSQAETPVCMTCGGPGDPFLCPEHPDAIVGLPSELAQIEDPEAFVEAMHAAGPSSGAAPMFTLLEWQEAAKKLRRETIEECAAYADRLAKENDCNEAWTFKDGMRRCALIMAEKIRGSLFTRPDRSKP